MVFQEGYTYSAQVKHKNAAKWSCKNYMDKIIMNRRIADSWNETINSNSLGTTMVLYNRMCFILLEQCQIMIWINQRTSMARPRVSLGNTDTLTDFNPAVYRETQHHALTFIVFSISLWCICNRKQQDTNFINTCASSLSALMCYRALALSKSHRSKQDHEPALVRHHHAALSVLVWGEPQTRSTCTKRPPYLDW